MTDNTKPQAGQGLSGCEPTSTKLTRVHTTDDIRRALVGQPVTLNGHDATISAGSACLVVRTLDGTMSGAWSYASAWRIVLHDGAFTL